MVIASIDVHFMKRHMLNQSASRFFYNIHESNVSFSGVVASHSRQFVRKCMVNIIRDCDSHFLVLHLLSVLKRELCQWSMFLRTIFLRLWCWEFYLMLDNHMWEQIYFCGWEFDICTCNVCHATVLLGPSLNWCQY